METGTNKKSINWQKVFGSNPCMKNRKEIRFFNGLGEIDYLTKIIKVKIDNQEYIMSYYYGPNEVEEIEIKNNRSVLILSLKYDKKKNDLKKEVNYDFTEVIIYFLYKFFKNRLENDKEFQMVMENLKKYEEMTLQISENSI